MIGDPNEWDATMIIDQEDGSLVAEGQEVKLMFDESAYHVFISTISQVNNSKTVDVAPPRLASVNGGPLAAQQNPDGSLSSNYFLRPGKSADLAVAMGSAGHTMEFLATALDKDELQQPWVKHAVLDVCKLFRKTKPVDVECGALFHAAHGLVLYREKVFGPRTFGKQAAE